MLEIKNISKTYSRQGKDFFAVKDVNLNILDGDFVHIIGRSGSGKSTLVKFLIGQLRPHKNTVFYKMEDLAILGESEIQRYRRKI